MSGENQYVEVDTEAIRREMLGDYEADAGRKLADGDPVRLFLLWQAKIIAHERTLINDAAKMNVLSSAAGEYLDSVGELYRDEKRLKAEAATTTLKFTLFAPQASSALIPKGTRAASDSGLMFAVQSDTYVPVGEITIETAAVCTTFGTVGNGLLPGLINLPVDCVSHVKDVVNVTESGGGSDNETDEAYRVRMGESLESISTADTEYGYIYHVKSVSSQITDVTAVSDIPNGIVNIKVLCADGAIPKDELLEKVRERLYDPTIKYLTVFISVSPPDIINYDIDFTYYILSNGENSADIESRVEKAVNDYKIWQSGKIGRDINPSKLNEMLMGAGLKRVDIRSPSYTPVDKGSVAVPGESRVVNGGFEDE